MCMCVHACILIHLQCIVNIILKRPITFSVYMMESLGNLKRRPFIGILLVSRNTQIMTPLILKENYAEHNAKSIIDTLIPQIKKLQRVCYVFDL